MDVDQFIKCHNSASQRMDFFSNELKKIDGVIYDVHEAINHILDEEVQAASANFRPSDVLRISTLITQHIEENFTLNKKQ